MIKLGLVDDESLVRASLKKLIPFEELGFELSFEADDGLEALELCRQFKPDILIADIRMPGLTGIELIQELKDILPSIKTVIISGHRDFEYAKTAIKYGVCDYILKPVNCNELVETLSGIKAEIASDRERAEREHTMKDRNNLANQAILERLMNRLVVKNTMLSSEILEELDSCGITYTKQLYSLMLLSPDDTEYFENNARKFEQFKKLVIYAAKKYMHGGIAFQPVNLPYSIMILINHSGQEELASLKSGEVIARLCREKFHTSLSLGFSEQVQSLGLLDKLYEQCCFAVRMRFWDQDTGCHKQYKYKSEQFAYKKPGLVDEDIINQLVFDIRLNQKENVKMFVDRILQKVMGQNGRDIDPAAFKEYIWAVLQIVLERIGLHLDFVSYESLVLGRHPKQKLDSVFTLKSFSEYLQEMLSRIFSFYNEKQNQIGGENPIETAKRIIGQNFDKDISLELISGYVHLSQAYFSDQFKKETGMSFTQYKALIKIENAKRLLKDTTSSITRVSCLVGYTDPKYFSRMFKKITGMSPAEYRDLI